MNSLLICGSRGYPARYGGFETLTQELANLLILRGFKVVVTGFSSDLHENSEENVAGVLCVNVRYRGWFRLANIISTFKATRIAVKRTRVTGAIVLNDINFLTAFYLKYKYKVPVIMHLDGDESIRRGIPWPGKLLHKIMRRLSLEFIDKVVIDSKELISTIKTRHTHKITVIKYAPMEVSKNHETFDSYLDYAPKDFFLNIARIVPENNVAEIAQAYLSSKRTIPLLIIGKGTGSKKYEKKIEKYVRESDGNIHFFESEYDPNKIIALMQNCSLYIHGHEAGGTNPIVVTARKYAVRLASHENRFNIEGSRPDEIFWNSPLQLMKIMDGYSSILPEVNIAVKVSSIEDSWEQIVTQYCGVLFSE